MGWVAQKLEDVCAGAAQGLLRFGLVQKLFSNLERSGQVRSSRRQETRIPAIAVGVTWLVLCAILFFFTRYISRYDDWPPAAYSAPSVFNLTKSSVKWDTYFGDPVQDRQVCGWLDCQVTSAWPADNFQKQVVLPQREFPLQNYVKGQTVYYRTTVTLPANLVIAKEMALFHSVYIWADRYEFYIDGELVDVGSKSLLNITIPRRFIERGQITLAFKIMPGELAYQGLSHYGEIVIGPRSILEPLAFTAREMKTTFYLWFILPRLTVCLIFCFIFLAMSKNFENMVFCLFVFTSSAKLILYSDYFEMAAPLTFNAFNVASVIDFTESLLFVLFVERFFRRNNAIFNRVIYAALGFAFFMLVVTVLGLPYFTDVLFALKRHVIVWTRIAAATYALGLALITTLFLAHTRKSRMRLLSSIFLSIFMLFSLGLFSAIELNLLRGSLSSIVLFSHDLALCVVLAGLAAFEFGSTVVQRDQIKTKFRQHVDPKVVDRLLERPETIKGQSRDVTILFTDVRSFTTISEIFPAEEVVGLLNEYFTIMVDVISAHGGVVDKFIGDAIMAVWGAPMSTERDAEMAARCAVQMRKELHLFNQRRKEAGKFAISIGIGIHAGRVIAGGVGSSTRIDYTVIGDTVNIAARIESLSKELKTDILISAPTVERIKQYAVVAPAGDFKLKGKAKSLPVYKLIGMYEAGGESLLKLECHCPIFAEVLEVTGPGIYECSVTNLVERVYEAPVSAQAA